MSMVYPSPTGSGILGFLDAYYKAQQNARANQAGEQVQAIHQMQLAQMEREAAMQAAIPGVMSSIANVADPNPPLTAAPRQPDITSQAAMDTGIPLNTMPPVPPTPAPQAVPGVPMGQVLQQVPQVATLLHRPEVQQALKARGVVSDAEFDTRRRQRQAQEDAFAALDDAQQSYLRRDPIAATLSEMKAYRTLLPVADNPRAILARLNDLSKRHIDLVENDEERTKTADEMAAFTEAVQSKDADRIWDVLGRATSKPLRMKAIEYTMKRADAAMKDPDPITVVESEAAKILEPLVRDGKFKPADRVKALQQVAVQNPEAFAAAYQKWGKNAPASWHQAYLGYVPTTNEVELAQQSVLSTGGDPNSPEGFKATLAALKSIRESRRAPERDHSTNDLLRLHRDENTRARDLKRELARLTKSDGFTGSVGSPDEIQAVKDELRDTENNIREYKRQLAGAGVGVEPTDRPEEPPRLDAAKGRTFSTLPPAAQYKDKTARDTDNGKRYRSDGVRWIEMK